jgi:hypothetical protein
MKIEVAKTTQTQEIYSLLQACATHMRENGIMQWNENYPLISHVERHL